MSIENSTSRHSATREAIADLVIERFVSQHPELRQASVVSEIPAPLRWAAIIMGAVMTASISAGFVWMVKSVNDMQLTLARMDERMESLVKAQDNRYQILERRVDRLEQERNGKHD